LKHVILVAAVLLIGAAVVVHPAFVAPAAPERQTPRLGDPPGQSSPERSGRVSEGIPRGAEALPQPRAAASKGAPVPAWRQMYARLMQEVSPSTAQQPMLEEVLSDRQHEIRQYHDLLRTVGAIDLRQYEWETGQMKESWFRKIDALLDRSQHEAFVVLVQRGFLNEGLDFVIEPGMTVID
jgi:hypothetical protein